jgi:LmbE family N-acetylglucosaminyl deacetylase
MHLYLSPHEDDAALSCGGQIAQLTRRGETVIIFTIMAGTVPPEFKPTELTRENHERWALGDDPITGRRNEDLCAAQALGAEVRFGPYPDALYRVHPTSAAPLYKNNEALFGVVHAQDPVLQAKRAAVVQAITSVFKLKDDDSIHIPLAIGRHVDHQLVRDMGRSIIRWRPNNPFFFYEDYPYARQGEAVVKAALAGVDVPTNRMTHPLDPDAIDAKIAAIKCYKSQLSGLDWHTPDAMAREVRTYIAQVGGEREWRVLYATDSPFS